jgi:hypothetical protein
MIVVILFLTILTYILFIYYGVITENHDTIQLGASPPRDSSEPHLKLIGKIGTFESLDADEPVISFRLYDENNEMLYYDTITTVEEAQELGNLLNNSYKPVYTATITNEKDQKFNAKQSQKIMDMIGNLQHFGGIKCGSYSLNNTNINNEGPCSTFPSSYKKLIDIPKSKQGDSWEQLLTKIVELQQKKSVDVDPLKDSKKALSLANKIADDPVKLNESYELFKSIRGKIENSIKPHGLQQVIKNYTDETTKNIYSNLDKMEKLFVKLNN